MKTTPAGFGISDEELAALGHVVIQATFLDYTVILGSIAFARQFPGGHPQAIQRMQFKDQAATLKTMFEKTLPKEAKEIDSFFGRLAHVRDERHAVAHRVWRLSLTRGEREIYDPREWKNVLPRRITVPYMEDLAGRLHALAQETNEWRRKCVTALVARRRA